MEVHGISAIKHVDAIVCVLGGMAVHDVHDDHHAQPMRLVHESLELIRRSKATACLQAQEVKCVGILAELSVQGNNIRILQGELFDQGKKLRIP